MRVYLSILFALLSLAGTAQFQPSPFTYNRDSIIKYRNLLENATSRKDRFRILVRLSAYYANSNSPTEIDSGLLYAHINLRETPEDHVANRAHIYHQIALCHISQRDMMGSVEASIESMRLYEQLGKDSLAMMKAFAIGNIYTHLGQISKAIPYHLKALKYAEKHDYKLEYMRICSGIADSYRIMGDYTKAIDYSSKALNAAIKSGNDIRIGYAYYSLASIMYEQENFEKSIEVMRKGEQHFQSSGERHGVALSQNLIGASYAELEQFNKALFHLKKARSIWIVDRMKEPYVASVDEVLGLAYYKLGQDDKAIQILENAIRICTEKGYYQQLASCYKTLYLVHNRKKNFQQALDAYVNYSTYNDSVADLANREALDKLESEHKEDTKQLMIDKLQAANVARDKEFERQRWQNIALFGCLGLAVVLVIIALIGYNNKRRSVVLINEQKQEAEEQRELANEQRLIAEEKNREILDSISYAKRLQDAVIPPAAQFIQNFSEGFVLFKPKDIVSGDFYWMSTSGSAVYFACVDCTGHGVPGAMVSMVGNNALNRCVREFGLTKPSEILDRLSDLVEETFKDSTSSVKDGMDIALCKFDRDAHTLEYAGANNPLWIIRSNGNEVEETKADKQPIGWFFEKQPFVNHEVALNPGDSIFLFSDGYADQFGGPKGKKFKYRQLRELLLAHNNKSMGELESILHQKFEEWRGELDQIDDVCVLGARV